MKLQLVLILYVALFVSCGLQNPVLVIEVAREGLATPKVPLISKQAGLKLTEYNDTLSEYGRQQQYLVGLEMRARYGKTVFEDKCNPLNIFAYSVSKESVMLSGQVQLFGICPLGSNHDITPDMVEKAFPPFDFPGKNKIAEELGLHATPYNFLPLPLHSTYNDPVFGAEDSDEYPIPTSDLPDSESEATIDRTFSDSLYRYLADASGLEQSEIHASNIVDTVNELIWLVKSKKLATVPAQVVRAAEDFLYQYYKHYWNKHKRDKYAWLFFKELLIKLKNAVLVKLNGYKESPIAFTVTLEKPDYDIKKIKYFLYEVGDLQMYTYANILKFDLPHKYIPASSILLFELHQTCELNSAMEPEDAMECFRLSMKLNDAEAESSFCKGLCDLKMFYNKVKDYFEQFTYQVN